MLLADEPVPASLMRSDCRLDDALVASEKDARGLSHRSYDWMRPDRTPTDSRSTSCCSRSNVLHSDEASLLSSAMTPAALSLEEPLRDPGRLKLDCRECDRG